VRPAINVGLSVSRVGGSAQVKAMKQVAGTLRLALAQYREMAAFAQFGSDLDAATQRQLNRGARLVEILKQGQYQPLPVEKQVLGIYAANNGFVDSYPTGAVQRYEKEMLIFMESRHGQILADLKEKKAIDADLEGRIKGALEEFKTQFVAE
jgi:F-type H+-transporting ATPase subunit alpha